MKKRLPLLAIYLLIPAIFMAQTGNVGIGTANPDTNAILELSSASKTLLLPRLNSDAFAALPGKEGMIAYDANTRNFAGYIGSGLPVTSNTNLSGRRVMKIDPSSHFIQTYTAPSTFRVKDIGLGANAGDAFVSFTLNIYEHTSGTLLGTASVTILPNDGGFRYFDFTADHIDFQIGHGYSFELLTNSTATPSLWFTRDEYSGGNMIYNGSNYPHMDLFFEVRSPNGPGRWALLATDSTLSKYATLNLLSQYARLSALDSYATQNSLAGYVNTTTEQSIAGVKIFSGNLIANKRVGIGVAVPHAQLQLDNTVSNRKLVLYETTNNDHEFLGFGINANTLRYQTAASIDDHVFFSATSATSSKELMRIRGNGRVGIGTSTPAHSLEIADDSDVSLYIRSSANDVNGMITLEAANRPTNSTIDEFMAFRLSGTRVGYITSNGIGGVSYSTTSDRRLKENIKLTTYGVRDLMKIGVMDYQMKGIPDATSTGFIAQDLHAIYPQAVTPGGADASEKPWTVDYGRITPLLTKSIQDQQAQIETLEARITVLEKQNSQIEVLAELVKDLQKKVSAPQKSVVEGTGR